MHNNNDIDILISEVGPRDGLQSVKATMPTELKLQWISALASAGLREIEIGSFVSPKLLPQMADAAQLVAHGRSLPGLFVTALVPNLRGAQAAFEAGVHKITMPISVSEPHSLSNIRKTHAQVFEEVRSVVALRNTQFPHIQIEAGLSTVFGCTIQGEVPEDDVIRMAVTMAEMGVDEVGLADTVGYANPTQVRRLFTRLRDSVGTVAGSAHFHNTRGQGLANVVAAIEVGVTTIDASQGGIGGCPYAPGASGNIVTEDLVYLLESMGLRTGVDIERLVAAREWLQRGLPGEPLYGFIPDAGVGKNFHYAKKDA
ncbi:isopropylmalate/homocitrate/citramalate synthase [Pseudomonas sp. GM49]|jgi:hydroxymethylglutaryl-CoA lyase|uniref:hydroxymethylglutaryl-CoA lyase n=1 Tax=Pseudomonas sp. GM49 TaxID=1144331 RepID=UPI000270C0B1|nr:hydroxymethylglutaryl-CoA lyase [Pseudomonas sp. GM49]EJM69989.1 isopropylmalate/homocitrate/citramalate synthase [Pseudomonas sp. GM49]